MWDSKEGGKQTEGEKNQDSGIAAPGVLQRQSLAAVWLAHVKDERSGSALGLGFHMGSIVAFVLR